MVLLSYRLCEPRHCAEHLSLDPNTVYRKCGVERIQDDAPKHCKEVVLLPLPRCYKHLSEWLLKNLPNPSDRGQVEELLAVAVDQLNDMQDRLAKSRRVNVSEYQRRCKQLPKCKSVVEELQQHLSRLTDAANN